MYARTCKRFDAWMSFEKKDKQMYLLYAFYLVSISSWTKER